MRTNEPVGTQIAVEVPEAARIKRPHSRVPRARHATLELVVGNTARDERPCRSSKLPSCSAINQGV